MMSGDCSISMTLSHCNTGTDIIVYTGVSPPKSLISQKGSSVATGELPKYRKQHCLVIVHVGALTDLHVKSVYGTLV